MHPPTKTQTTPKPRRDGWTAERRQLFVDTLAAGLDVRRACRRLGLSRQGVYRLRARDAEFARAWDEALHSARVAEERCFRALVAEHLPWARSEPSGACRLRGAEASPQDRVTPVRAVSPSAGRHALLG